MDKFIPPGSLNFDGDLAENWRKWRQEFDFFMVATESDAKSDKVQTSISLTSTLCILPSNNYGKVEFTFIFDGHENARKHCSISSFEYTDVNPLML